MSVSEWLGRKPGREHLAAPRESLPVAGWTPLPARLEDNDRMKAQAGIQTRIIAAQVIDGVMHRGRSLKAALAQALPTLADTRDRAMVEAICFAALRQHARADAALKTWLARPLAKGDGELRGLLHAGFAQLDPLGFPAHAAVASTVEAARVMGRVHQAGMVNAMLRRAQREGLPVVPAAAQWPAWLQKQLRQDWPADVDDIIDASAVAAPLWLRVNRRHGSREAYLQRLAVAGIEAVAFDGLADAIRIEASLPVQQLPGFAEGDVSVQDGSAQAVADALAPAPGARVLDACAAPGGKSAHLLERDPSLQLLALDIDTKRLASVRATFDRLGVGASAMLKAADAGVTDGWWDGVPFDAILLDAPCSATGIVRRQPDVLLHRRASDIKTLVGLQRDLLDATWSTLRPGGALLYATCSILKAENAAQIDDFLARTPDAVAQVLPETFGRVSGAGRQRLPGEGGMDGFFYALLRRR